MEVKILTENTVYKRGFLGEHGLSLWIETGDKKYLFDTGQSGVFLQNAGKMRLAPERLDGIILSHGHYDHCGGMAEWAIRQEDGGRALEIPIYINQRAFDKKYSRNPATGELLFGGIPEDAEQWMKESANLICTSAGCTEIAKDVYLLSEIPCVTDFESAPARFLKEMSAENCPGGKACSSESRELKYSEETSTENCPGGKAFGSESEKPTADRLTADTMEDEQLLVIREKQGLCVFAGCAHPGIVNCLNYVQYSFPGEHIHSLVAGMHLKGCSSKQLERTVNSLQELKIDVTVPLHCTGILAIAAIREAMGEQCVLAEVGKTIVL